MIDPDCDLTSCTCAWGVAVRGAESLVSDCIPGRSDGGVAL